MLHGHVPAMVSRLHLQPMGTLTNTLRLNLAIGLPLRNQEALTNLLQQLYDPASPNYRHYLTPAQFTEQFGPTEKDYQAVIAFMESKGLTVTYRHPNRVVLDVSGSVTNVQRAMHVTMRTYRHPTENRTFYAPDVEPSLDLTVPILDVSGLNNYSLPRPRLVIKPANLSSAALSTNGSGTNGAYMGKDFRAAYAPNVTLTGTGQAVGLLEFDGYSASDITNYEQQAGLPNVTLTNVLLGGYDGSAGANNNEVCLDIEMAISMAPGLSKVIVYEEGGTEGEPGSWHDILNKMATDDSAKQLSCSWFIPGGLFDPAADQIFQQMAAQGQSFFDASGDKDAYTGLIDFPGDSPYITQVGGTTLTMNGLGASYASETVWNWGHEYYPQWDGTGSGGGVSTQYPIPPWQANVNMTANQGSTTMRNTPDVALTADNVWITYGNGKSYTSGGTSAAAPLWAGFTALVNQQAADNGKPAVGFLNPAIYAIGNSANYASAFHDITTGDNTWTNQLAEDDIESSTNFYATNGYDLCTGWGTPNGQNLINLLANPEPLQIIPIGGFNALGFVGGPFSLTNETFSLTNTGTTSLNWSLANTSLWLNASSSGGTLTPGGTTNVTVSLNPSAYSLTPGAYIANVRFTNLTDNVVQGRQFTLAVFSYSPEPTNQTIMAGGTATFSVAASVPGFFTYQWQLNGTNLPNGIITTVAGGGSPPYLSNGDGDWATNASLGPWGVAVDASGDLFIVEGGGQRRHPQSGPQWHDYDCGGWW